MNVRKLTLDEIRDQHFAKEDALNSFEERFERLHKLKTAMALTNNDHDPITLYVKLASGEIVEIASDLIDLGNDFVEIHGGFDIPLIAIVEVGV